MYATSFLHISIDYHFEWHNNSWLQKQENDEVASSKYQNGELSMHGLLLDP